ncbi:ArdC-like ssDNA-binding domain-containing protein [Dehalococcoides mccartyi]|uniref:ArdC-like ssDNA-binding domain-containing protein n=1 Tax=Dehalococcoides mccartyi TaxID=61435 RepID=UPI00398B51D1
MAGQAYLQINEKEWLVSLAIASWELEQGLGGLLELDSGNGMLFDLGVEQTVHVTTVPMLFPLDIAFLSADLKVTEIFQNVAPGYLVTSTQPARYFIEVNAGDMTGIEPGNQVSLEILPFQDVPVELAWESAMFSFMGFTLLGIFTVGMVKNLFLGASDNSELESLAYTEERKPLFYSKCAFCTTTNHQCEICEKISPRDYHLISWFGAPVPDYSFAIESEAKERKIDDVLKRLKEGVDGIQQSENFRNFLLTMSKFHNYSIGNLILIMLQKPDATRVAGFSTWKDLYRWVKKGEKGIAILAPCMPPKGSKPEATEAGTREEDEEKQNKDTEIRPVYFKVVYVFDVSQTEGKPLPEVEVPSLTGEANEELFDQVMRLSKVEGLDVSFEPRPQQDPDIKGYYTGKTIWVRPEESRAQQLKTLLHEMAHYFSENVFRIPRSDAETIAESVAFTIGAHFGFDTGTRSFPYVAIWSKDKKVLEANLAAIRKVSEKIFDGLEQIAKTRVGVA